MSQNPIVPVIVTALFSGLATGCVYEDMQPCPDDYGIVVKNDWGSQRNVDPEGMACLFFPEGENDYWRFDLPGKDGGEVRIPMGTFNFVTYNDDTSGIDFIIRDGGRVFATTYECTLPRHSADSAEAVMTQPDRLWGYGIDKVIVSNAGVEYGGQLHGNREVVAYPMCLTTHYSLRVLHVKNLHGVAALSGAISGQSGEVCVNSGERSQERVAVPFDIEVRPDSTLYATFDTFGISPGPGKSSAIDIFFRLSDGRRVDVEKDVTSQILSASDPFNVELVVDSISLPWAPPAEIEGGAFAPSVEGWIEISINY